MDDEQLAQKWGCAARTIRNWRRLGAPLTNERKMSDWLLGRKGLPAATQKTLNDQLSTEINALLAAMKADRRP